LCEALKGTKSTFRGLFSDVGKIEKWKTLLIELPFSFLFVLLITSHAGMAKDMIKP